MPESHIFLSYSRDDLKRAKRIVDGLTAEGISIWWDQQIPTGATWRVETGDRLKTATAVVVLWTKISVRSQWVLEEADSGRQRGVLCPVLLDAVEQPIGFGSTQACKLVKWSGDRRDPEWRHFVSSLLTKMGRVDGAGGCPRRIPIKKLAISASIGAAAVLAFAGLGLGTPTGAAWIANMRATQLERQEWQKIRKAASCELLGKYLDRKPDGPFAGEARLLLQRARTVRETRLTQTAQPIPGFGVSLPSASGSRASACESARGIVRATVAENCALLEAGGQRKVRPAIGLLACSCRDASGAWQCEAKGPARCEAQAMIEHAQEKCDG